MNRVRREQLERSRLELQSRLDAAKTAAERNRLGQFATPPTLADELVALALAELAPRSDVRFLDPAFGTGAFFSALLGQVPESKLKAASGFEVDPHYGTPARELWTGTPLDLRLDDFTRHAGDTGAAGRFNLVVCNPPYVRHHHLPRETKERLQGLVQASMGLRLNGLSGLYCYFLLLSQSVMAPGGVGAWLVPTEFLDVNYGAQVKRFLSENVTLLRVHRFESADVQFDDALVSSAVVVFKNQKPFDGHRVLFSGGGTLTRPASTAEHPIGSLGAADKWTTLSHATEPQGSEIGLTLGDFFTIKRGLATGCNEFFVLTGERAAELGIPRDYLRPILPSPRELASHEILADPDGDPMLAGPRYLLDTDRREADIRRDCPDLWRYLESGVEQGIHRRFLCSRRSPWYSQERRPATPFLCTYMGRATRRSTSPFRFILNHSRATAANVYLMMYPKPALARYLARSPGHAAVVWDGLRQLSVASLKAEGRLYGGGLHKMEPNELSRVPAGRLAQMLPHSVLPKTQINLFHG
jgi:hypothetical protein